MEKPLELDIDAAIRARRSMMLAAPVARLVVLVGTPISWLFFGLFVLPISGVNREDPEFAIVGAAYVLSLPVYMFIVGLLVIFADKALRPWLGTLAVCIGAGPAVVGLFAYFRPADSASSLSVVLLLLTPVVAPTLVLLNAGATGLMVPPVQRSFARAAPQMPDMCHVLRECLGVWPGFRRPSGAMFASSLVSHAATTIAWVGTAGTLAGVSVLAFLLGLVWITLLGASMSIAETATAIGLGVLFLLALVVAFLLGIFVSVRLASATAAFARHISRQSFERTVQIDTRPPILYLRSFANDQTDFRAKGFTRWLRRSRDKLDYLLVEQFSRFGPIVAIGKPGDKALPFGAARRYVADAEWRQVVSELMETARFIVIVADDSLGLRWELETVLCDSYRHKTLVLASPGTASLLRNQVCQAYLGGVRQGKPAVAMFGDAGSQTVLRATSRHSESLYLVALQAFFSPR